MKGLDLEDYLGTVKSGPACYYLKEGILEKSGELLEKFGKKAFISSGKKAWDAIKTRFVPSLERANISYELNIFPGESTEKNIDKVVRDAKLYGADFIVGVGGGKSLDTAKTAADILNIPVVTVPTIAATCACSSPLCIIYSEEGTWLQNYYPKTNPNMVLADPKVLVDAPIEYVKSGMIDSLAKWYEGSLSLKSSDNADIFDFLAIDVAESLRTDMFKKADGVIRAVKERDYKNKEFLDIVNLNLYVAGTIQALGVKAVRNGIAHSVHNGLTALPDSHHLTHGIKVGYGIAVQMILEKYSDEEIEQLIDFYKNVELKPTFQGLNLKFTKENVKIVAEKTIESSDMRRKPFDLITVDMIENAINQLEENEIVNNMKF